MSFSRFTILAVLLVFAGCTESGNESTFEYLPIYGDGSVDKSAPVAQVGDVVITQKMLDTRFTELPPRVKVRFGSEEGRRLLLNLMVDETIPKHLPLMRIVDPLMAERMATFCVWAVRGA